MGGTDIWEAGTDTNKTTGRLEAHWEVKARIPCLQYFYIFVTKRMYDVLEHPLGFQIQVEWRVRIRGRMEVRNSRDYLFASALLPNSVFYDFEQHCCVCA